LVIDIDVGSVKFEGKRAHDWDAGLLHFFHEFHFVWTHIDENLRKLFKELSNFSVVPNLSIKIRIIAWMSSENGIRERAHFAPSHENFIIALNELETLSVIQSCITSNIGMSDTHA